MLQPPLNTAPVAATPIAVVFTALFPGMKLSVAPFNAPSPIPLASPAPSPF